MCLQSCNLSLRPDTVTSPLPEVPGFPPVCQSGAGHAGFPATLSLGISGEPAGPAVLLLARAGQAMQNRRELGGSVQPGRGHRGASGMPGIWTELRHGYMGVHARERPLSCSRLPLALWKFTDNKQRNVVGLLPFRASVCILTTSATPLGPGAHQPLLPYTGGVFPPLSSGQRAPARAGPERAENRDAAGPPSAS